jgi:hypothetical protein
MKPCFGCDSYPCICLELYRDSVIEECAKIADDPDGNFGKFRDAHDIALAAEDIAKAIRDLKAHAITSGDRKTPRTPK